MVHWLVRNASRSIRPLDVVNWFSVDHGTVNRWLHKAGYPVLHRAIRLARLMHVVRDVERNGSSAAITARRLGFSSSAALGMFVLRSCSVSFGELRGERIEGALIAACSGLRLEPADWR